jgi:hypothetical protein
VRCKGAKGAIIKQRGQKKINNLYLVKGKEGKFREIN